MSRVSLAIALVGWIGVEGIARADQCAYVEPAVADAAARILAGKPRYVELCEPCGETRPSAVQRVDSVTIATPTLGYREVSIDGKPIDLAYTFVETSPSRFDNLAKLVKCPAEDVSASITVEPPARRVVADDPEPEPAKAPLVLVQPAVPPTPRAAAPPAASSPPPAPEVPTTPHWQAIAIACAAGSVGAGLGALTALARQRR